MHKWLILFCLISTSAFAQDYPEHLQSLVTKAEDYFHHYGQKSPAEIEDGSYDDSESHLFSYVDQINGLDIIFSKEDIRKIKTHMVKLISESFDISQIEAIIRVAKSPEINKKITARYFEFALEYKTGKNLDIQSNFLLSSELKPMR